MKWTTTDIKNVLAASVEKQGASLQDLEQAMQGADSIEKFAANLEKLGKDGIPSLTDIWTPIHALANFGGLASLGTGALGGLGLYGAYKQNQDSTDKQLKRQRELEDYKNATRSLQEAYLNEQQPSM